MAASKTHRFTSTLERSTNRLWSCHFSVPLSIAKQLIHGADRRVLCSLNGAPVRQCALIPHGKGEHVVTVNVRLRKELRISFGSKVDVRLRKDESTYGLPMPEELEELLRQDSVGKQMMHALTPGKLRTLLYIIGKAKTVDQRLLKSTIIVRHVKENAGKIAYRKLGAELKRK